VHQVWFARTPVAPEFPAHQLGLFGLPPGADCFVQFDATGTIWSGVLLTGDTPPSGWDMLVDDAQWPYHGHPDAHRYSLIARFEYPAGGAGSSDWFYVGSARTVPIVRNVDPATQPATDPLALWLAVNRPHIDRTADGSGAWEVDSRVFASDAADRPDCTTSPLPPPNPACVASMRRLTDLRNGAAESCDTAHREQHRADSDQTAFWALVTALGVDIAVIGALVGVGIAAAAQVEGAVRAALITASTAPGGGWITAAGAAAPGFAEAVAAGTAGAGGLGPVGWAIFAGLVAIGVGLLVALIALAVDLENANASVRNARTTFNSTVAAIRTELTRTGIVCCPGTFDTSIPECA